MTDATLADKIIKKEESAETKQIKSEFRMIRGIGPGENVPEDLIKSYKKFNRQRSICDVRGPIGILEKLLLSNMYDMVNGDFDMAKPKHAKSAIPENAEPKEEDDPETYEYKDDETVSVMFEGKNMLGRFLGYEGKKLKIKVGGDNGANFRKMTRKEVRPYKE